MKRNFESRIRSLEKLAGGLRTEKQLEKDVLTLYRDVFGLSFELWMDFENYLIRQYPEACRADYIPVRQDNTNPEDKTEVELKAEIEVLCRTLPMMRPGK